MQHFVPALWEIHKVHHSATFLNPLTARRGHPLGFVFDGTASAVLVGIPAGLFHVFLNFSLIDILFLYTCASKLGTVVTLDALKHSQFPIRFGRLERIFISPYMHQIHHSTKVEHLDKNFGVNLSVWDWIFGTAVSPDKYEKIVYGFGSETEEDYERLWGVYAGPFLKIWCIWLSENDTQNWEQSRERHIGDRLARAFCGGNQTLRIPLGTRDRWRLTDPRLYVGNLKYHPDLPRMSPHLFAERYHSRICSPVQQTTPSCPRIWASASRKYLSRCGAPMM